MQQADNKRTAFRLAVVAVLMFGFGYAMVPLYDVFCDITGINGKTGRINVIDAQARGIDEERSITVQFDANVNPLLPWRFSSKQQQIQVHPGEIREALFFAENLSGKPIIGQAVPSVAPGKASVFFKKTECFCFTQQVLQANERREMPVRFIIDPDIPEDVEIVTLSYTFFMAPDQTAVTENIDKQKNNS